MSNQCGCTRLLLTTDVFNARFTTYSRQHLQFPVAAKLSHRSTEVANDQADRNTPGRDTRAPSDKKIRKVLQISGVTSNTATAPQIKSARHPEFQSASQNCQNHTFPITLIPDRSSGTEVLTRRFIGTCAQMETIITTPPLFE